MGIFGNLVGSMFGAGGGTAGAHNALIAEWSINNMTNENKKRIAEHMVYMGVQASGGRVPAERFLQTFNKADRLCQLNVVALALADIDNGYFMPKNVSLMNVSHPFCLVISKEDIEIGIYWLQKKYKLDVKIKSESINIYEWLK